MEKTVRSTYSISMLNLYLGIDSYLLSLIFDFCGIKVKFLQGENVNVVICDEQELNRICMHGVNLPIPALLNPFICFHILLFTYLLI